MEDKQFVYVTGHNATGKTSLGKNALKEKGFLEQGWHCIDGDEFVGADPELQELLITTSQTGTMELMRGNLNLNGLTEEARYEQVKKHDAEVRATWEPFFRKLFERLKQHMSESKMNKVIFPYHCWRSWTIDLLREYFGNEGCKCKIIEVTTDANLRYQRWVDRQVGKGLDVEKVWRERQGEHMTALRNTYGPEYNGNEEHFLKYVEQRYFFPREPMPQDQSDIFFIKNDNFDGLKEMIQILGVGV